jgi:DNA-nicking Smr family endonuclease
VVETVRPLDGVALPFLPPEELGDAQAPPSPAPARPKPSPPSRRPPGETLDGTWDRRLSRGLVQPDMTVDLHGHNLAGAYALLDEKLGLAISRGDRVILLITGKPPKGEPPVQRGRIRAAVGDWLAASPHSGNIAAVRGAHPRHGGAGALYIVLKRQLTK